MSCGVEGKISIVIINSWCVRITWDLLVKQHQWLHSSVREMTIDSLQSTLLVISFNLVLHCMSLQ